MHESEKVKVKSLSRVRLLVTPWTAAYQAPPSMGFPKQEYWSGVPLPLSPVITDVLSPFLKLINTKLKGTGVFYFLMIHTVQAFWLISYFQN